MIKRNLLMLLLGFIACCSSATNFNKLALSYIKSHQNEFNLRTQDISGLKKTDQYTDEYSGITHIWFQQTVDGIELKNSSIALHFTKEMEVFHFTTNGIVNLQSKVNESAAALSIKNAVDKVAQLLVGQSNVKIDIKEKISKNDIVLYPITSLTNEPVYVKKVFYNDVYNNKIKLCWEIYIEEIEHNHIWTFYVDANTGELISKVDNVVHCEFQPLMYKSNGDNISHSSESNQIKTNDSNDKQILASSYRVYPYYIEAPNFGGRELLTDPSNVVASPYGWHDTNGASGPEYTITRGNNVNAYQDKNANNNVDAGSQPDGTSSLTFDFPINFSVRMDSGINAKAAVTQLFYVNNIMHDIMYKYGFTEAAGNFQSNNYGKGGAPSDFVLAEAHDGAGLNNASFSTPVDGQKPRMQMYLWGSSAPPNFNINAPALIAGTYDAAPAAFGPCQFTIAGQVANAFSNTTNLPPSWVCGNVSNGSEVNGKIALIDRGSCEFGEKALKAQNAGAIGVIIINFETSGDTLLAMAPGAMGLQVTIPTVMVTFATGQLIRNNLSTANITLSSGVDGCLRVDGDLDNGIIAHEYGHGISNRLAGGPSNSSCLSNDEQGGEGWSDFFALALTHKPTDTKNTARGSGTYVLSQPFTGTGIRRHPYSYDLGINPITYADMAANTNSHRIGEIWCSVLWDMYWNLIDKYGYSNDLYNGTAGNNRAIKLVLEGLKLQRCNGGYIDYRNAILKADSILYGYADKCEIWNAFARRGMGYSANQGLASSATDQTAAYDLPPTCNSTILTSNFGVNKTQACVGEVLVFKDSTLGIANSWLWDFGDGSISNLQNPTKFYLTAGTYSVKLVISNTTTSDSLTKINLITITEMPATPTITQSHDTLNSGTIVVGGIYKWYLGSSLVATTTTPYYKFSTNGSYTVTVTNSGCVSAVSAAFPASSTGIINSPNSIKLFEIYPNPTEGKLTLNLSLHKTSSVSISLFTAEGREIYLKSYGNTKSVFEEMNIGEFAKGLYILKLRVDDEIYYHKLIKD